MKSHSTRPIGGAVLASIAPAPRQRKHRALSSDPLRNTLARSWKNQRCRSKAMMLLRFDTGIRYSRLDLAALFIPTLMRAGRWAPCVALPLRCRGHFADLNTAVSKLLPIRGKLWITQPTSATDDRSHVVVPGRQEAALSGSLDGSLRTDRQSVVSTDWPADPLRVVPGTVYDAR